MIRLASTTAASVRFIEDATLLEPVGGVRRIPALQGLKTTRSEEDDTVLKKTMRSEARNASNRITNSEFLIRNSTLLEVPEVATAVGVLRHLQMVFQRRQGLRRPLFHSGSLRGLRFGRNSLTSFRWSSTIACM